ncbi:MAG: hypothetical protein U0791_23320 [Gemmataceae bacterium]
MASGRSITSQAAAGGATGTGGKKAPAAKDNAGNSVALTGAVGVNLTSNAASATIGDNLSVTAGGPLTLASFASTDADAARTGGSVGDGLDGFLPRGGAIAQRST